MGSAVTEAQDIVAEVKEPRTKKKQRKAVRKFAKRVSRAMGKLVGEMCEKPSNDIHAVLEQPIQRIGDCIQELLDKTKKPVPEEKEHHP